MKLLTPLLALLLTILLCTCGPAPETCPPCPQKQEQTVANYSFVRGERFGNLPFPVTLADLQEAYGDDLVPGTLYGPEGMESEGHRLFAGTDNEVRIYSDSPDSLRIEISGPGSLWYDSEHLIRIGTSIDHLTEVNGKPFIFSGFDWDYGGNSYEWNGGELTGAGFRLIYGGYEYTSEDEGMDAFMGDQPVSSDAPGLDVLDVRVAEMYLSLYE